jgi:two-component system CheB/CheR fusion protein
MATENPDTSFESLLTYLRQSRAFDFTGYKRPSLMRRVTKRMLMVSMDNFSDYIDYLEVHPEEFTHLFNTILINVTSFFRDLPAWDYLAKEIIPQVVQDENEPVRVWSAGCASGEEAYTVAIVLAEALGVEAFKKRAKVYATDVDEEALTTARQASYGNKELEPVSDRLREKYFETVAGRCVFRADLRRSIIFGRNDLVQDAPISRLDLLVSRNTLMYFNAEAQGRILARFHYALNKSGFLFLGRAEMLLTHGNLFTPVELKYRIFTKVPDANMRDHLLVAPPPVNHDPSNQPAKQFRLYEIALDVAPMVRIVADLNGNLVLASQKARTLFGLTSKDIGRPLQDLEISYRPVELRSFIDQAYAERRAVTLANVERRPPEGEIQHYDVIVVPLFDNGNAIGVSISFADVTRHYKLTDDLQHSKEDLATALEQLQSTHEELETTNEELQSTNEELETTNEELHSTNEELETMNEEMQSTNEELQTTNDQLHQRSAELDSLNVFLNSILSSLRDAVVVVDRNLNVLIWSQMAEKLWGLRADEVKGHPLLNLDIGLPVGQLRAPIRACVTDETKRQEMTLDAVNRRGKAIKCRIALTPLNGPQGEHQGAILMMEELGM